MFTPGPWRVGKHGSVVTDHLVGAKHLDEMLLEYYGGEVVCETVTPLNAMLIAEAPLMYDMLVHVRDVLRELYDDEDFDQAVADIERVLARAAGLGAAAPMEIA